MQMNSYSEITPEILDLAQMSERASQINADLYQKYDVKRGLRDINGKGVLAGLTEIGEVQAYKTVDGKEIPCEGKLYYRGHDIEELVKGFVSEKRFGFEEITYLLLFGELPNGKELSDFCELLGSYRTLPTHFVRDIIMKAPSKDMMNTLARSVLTLYSYDDKGDDISIPNVLRQSLQLIAKMPQIAVHSYCAWRHFHADDTLVIRLPNKDMSIAENILQMLRPDGEFTELEAKVLDVALVLHAEHGGGNNSTFTNHVVTSSGTDTYSATAASIASLKGPRHGGANLKVQQMFADIKKCCPDYEDEKTLTKYLEGMLDKKVFDKSGLIYGMGHAVYTLSDPREVILKSYAKRLSEEKGLQKEYELYERVERLAGEAIARKRHLFKPICANVDFYSGFVYSMLGIPEELYTPIFAISRISGWSAHRLEEVVNNGKIIRPAYKYVGYHRPYCALDERHE